MRQGIVNILECWLLEISSLHCREIPCSIFAVIAKKVADMQNTNGLGPVIDNSAAFESQDKYLAAIERGLNHPNIDPTASVLRKLRQALHSYKG